MGLLVGIAKAVLCTGLFLLHNFIRHSKLINNNILWRGILRL